MPQANMKSGGALGWVAAVVLGLVAIGQCSSNRSSTNTAAEVAGSPGSTRYVSARSLNCRSTPSPSAAVVRGFGRGEAVTVAEEVDGWARVQGASPCWVAASFLDDADAVDGIGAAIAGSAAGAGAATRAYSGGADGGSYSSGSGTRQSFASPGDSSSARATGSTKRTKSRRSRTGRKARYQSGGSGCPCSGSLVCIGPRGGRYCITSGGNKRYGV
jgi:hypothetical protein